MKVVDRVLGKCQNENDGRLYKENANAAILNYFQSILGKPIFFSKA